MIRSAEQGGRDAVGPRLAIVSAYIYVALAYCAASALTYYYVVLNNYLAFVHGASFVIIAAAAVLLRQTHNIRLATSAILVVGTWVVVSLFVTGGWDNTGYIWPFAYLVFVLFFSNRNDAKYWIALLYIACLLAVVLHAADIIAIPYSAFALVNYFAALIITIILIFLYQKTTVDYEEFLTYSNGLLEANIDAFFTIDSKGRVRDVNKATEKITGLTRSQLIGSDFATYFTETEKASDTCQHVFNGSVAKNIPLSLRHYKGHATPVWVNAILYRQANKKENMVFAIARDITERKQAENTLKMNAELKTALQKLEANNQYLEQLAYISAHDIKAPIVTLEGLVSLLSNSNAVKEEYTEVVAMSKSIVQQMYRTNHSLNNILKLRKNLIYKADAKDQMLPLKSIVNDVCATIKPDLEAASGTLSIDLGEVANKLFPYVHLKSVFYNLLNNAIKYRDPAKQLTITVKARYIDGTYWGFTVQDNGLGIDLEHNRDRIFGIFKRFHDHTDGTGVGLHIVKSIIEAYGGTIDVDSEPRKGTVFNFTFTNTILT